MNALHMRPVSIGFVSSSNRCNRCSPRQELETNTLKLYPTMAAYRELSRMRSTKPSSYHAGHSTTTYLMGSIGKSSAGP